MVNMHSTSNVRDLVVGTNEPVRLLSGEERAYINFDNASSTPFLRSVLDRINEFAPLYASVGRGSGYKSHVSTEAFEAARATIGEFVGARKETHTVILGKNTTEALNKLVHCLELAKDDVVLTSLMEHHSNELPWRRAGTVKHIGLLEDGSLDLSHLQELLEQYQGSVRLVSITGASNVTGFINPIYDIAELVHDAGALLAVDAAQLAPHRAIDVGSPGDPRRLDFVAYTGHKMYAPLGIGALVALRDAVRAEEPDLVGGGTVDLVTQDDVVWSSLPAREEAGSQNIVGAIGWAQAINTLSEMGMDKVALHESRLARALLTELQSRDSIDVYGDADPAHAADRLGVVTVSIRGVDHHLAAAILGYEGGIGVRTGMFCAHPYVLKLMGVDEQAATDLARRLRSGGHPDIPGLIRASFGIYNTYEEVEEYVSMLDRIATGSYAGEYLRDERTGAFRPSNTDKAWAPPKLRGLTVNARRVTENEGVPTVKAQGGLPVEPLLEAVPQLDRFLTVDELDRSSKQLASEHSKQVRCLEIGRSTDGHPIQMLQIGKGEEHLLFFACPHPNEPIGAMALEVLSRLLVEHAELRGTRYTWNLIKCIDPDGTRLNEGWFSGPFTVTHYAKNFFRPGATMQAEWTFPIRYKTYSFLRPIPETQALMTAITGLRPRFIYSLHNAGMGGGYYYLTPHQPQLDDELRRLITSRGIPLALGEPEMPWGVKHSDAIYKTPTLRDQYDFMAKQSGKDPADMLKMGEGSYGFARDVCDPAHLMCELPYFFDARTADTSPAEGTRREAILSGLDAAQPMIDLLNETITNVADELITPSRLRDASLEITPMLVRNLEMQRQWAENDPDLDTPATVAGVFDSTLGYRFYRLLFVGMARRTLKEQLSVCDSPNLQSALARIEKGFERWSEELESKLDYRAIPIRDLVQIQLGAAMHIIGSL